MRHYSIVLVVAVFVLMVVVTYWPGRQRGIRARRPHPAATTTGKEHRLMPTKIEKDTVSGRDTTGHEWDGLKELNTPLPKWWLYVLAATRRLGGGADACCIRRCPYGHRLLPRACSATRSARAVDADVKALVAQRAVFMDKIAALSFDEDPKGSAARSRWRRPPGASPSPTTASPATARAAAGGRAIPRWPRRLALGRHAGATSSRPSRTASAAAIRTRATARCRASAPTAS